MIDLRPIVNLFALRCLAVGLGAVMFVIGLVVALPSPRVAAQSAVGLGPNDADRVVRAVDRNSAAIERLASAVDRAARSCGR